MADEDEGGEAATRGTAGPTGSVAPARPPAKRLIPDHSLFRRILDDLPDGVYITDRERRVRYWNHAAERITGYGAEHVVGRRCADNILIHVDADGTPM
jgi:PAS domain-containing protein